MRWRLVGCVSAAVWCVESHCERLTVVGYITLTIRNECAKFNDRVHRRATAYGKNARENGRTNGALISGDGPWTVDELGGCSPNHAVNFQVVPDLNDIGGQVAINI